MPFITKEKIKKPRILLLDFDKKVSQYLKDAGYNVFVGESGYSGKSFNIPVHRSELELIFWDCSNIVGQKTSLHSVSYDGIVSIQRTLPYQSILGYVEKIKSKNGITTLFLGDTIDGYEKISKAVGSKFTLRRRETTSIFSVEDEDFGPFLNKHIKDENIKFSVSWVYGVNYVRNFFVDEDDNFYGGFGEKLLILPKVNHKQKAILSLLQDVFPKIADPDLFPDLSRFNWLNDENYQIPSVLNEINYQHKIEKRFREDLSNSDLKIKNIEEDYSYLSQSLISDDSELFPESKRLKAQVKIMLKLFDFTIEDIDIKNKEMGKSLVEDLQIRDGDYLSLVETKGTEKGAKSNWIKKDFVANINIYTRINDLKPSEVSSMLIFNHERRIDPLKRTEPYKDDPDLIKYCVESKITIIPIHQLYLLCRKVIFDNFDKKIARELLKEPGLFKSP